MNKREDYISWDEYFMGVAMLSAMRSKDPNTQVGACIVSEDHKILSMGYNGLPVGCSDDDREVLVGGNRMVDYSGRGPTAACICKPDLVAPGCSVVSCSSRADKYTIKSGTSMSTPIVSGAVALLLERFPDMSNKDVKLRLRESSVDIGLPRNQQGWGLLDVGKMLER